MKREEKPIKAPHDDDEEEEVHPLEGLDKSAVLQECKEFSAVSIKVNDCISTMTRVLYMLAKGETLTATEATDVFFGATKLFQCEHQKLRRMLYVTLKELSVHAEQVFIASSSLVKDISSNNDMYRANAIRTLCKVTDCSMIGPMERYLKQAVVDKNNNVVSAAIVAGIHFSLTQPEMVKRWGTEVSEALKNKGNRVQYHALALLHKLRKSDRMSVIRLVQQAQNGPIRAPLALCLLIRMCTELMQEDFGQSTDLYKFVSNMTHHSSDMVVFEAAKSICSLRNITAKEVTPAALVLQLYLASQKPIFRFAAVRLLNRIASRHPAVVVPCNIDLETLIGDTNRSVATLAITTMLKTGSEFSMERLMKQIAGFLPELSDEFKIVVVDAMKVLSVKFPTKYAVLLQFLSEALHEEGGAEYKRAVLETVVSIIKTNPAAKEAALQHLCEFIEDCEYNVLVQRVLYLLGQEGPTTSCPQKYIRYIYNRVALEAPAARAVAVATLAKFGALVPTLRPSITPLLKRAMADADDEVRDRATFYFRIFSRGDETVIRTLVSDIASSVGKERSVIAPTVVNTSAADVAAPPAAVEPSRPLAEGAAPTAAESQAAVQAEVVLSAQQQSYREKLFKIAQFRTFGEPLRTCDPVALTEPDCEYVVSVIKHIFSQHIVFQYRVTNTIEDKIFYNATIHNDLSDVEGCEPLFAMPISSIKPGQTEYAYIVVGKQEGDLPSGTVQSSFLFVMADPDDAPPTDAEGEEYPLDEFAVNLSDYCIPTPVADFDRQWDLMQYAATVDTYSLQSMRNLTAAAKELIDFYGMFVVGGAPDKITTKSHVINMSANLAIPGKPLLLISGKVFLASDASVALQLSLRGATDEIRARLSAALVS